ncbi:uncharacterized protein LOC113474395 [Ciona intestinalis]
MFVSVFCLFCAIFYTADCRTVILVTTTPGLWPSDVYTEVYASIADVPSRSMLPGELQKVCSSTKFNPCHEYADCTQLKDAVQCMCRAGYIDGSLIPYPPSNLTANGTNCIDLNECDVSNYTCGGNLNTCTNTNGSYVCNCSAGYQYNATTNNCTDLDECFGINTKCGIGTARCENTAGSYFCTCRNGFLFNDTLKACLDVDECLDRSACDVNAVCRNNIGSYTCSCLPGFTGRQGRCFDIDECKDPVVSAACSVNGKCENTFGSYQCNCFVGYMKGTVDQHKTCIGKQFRFSTYILL